MRRKLLRNRSLTWVVSHGDKGPKGPGAPHRKRRKLGALAGLTLIRISARHGVRLLSLDHWYLTAAPLPRCRRASRKLSACPPSPHICKSPTSPSGAARLARRGRGGGGRLSPPSPHYEIILGFG